MIFSQTDPSGFVVSHLLKCFKEPLLRVDDDDTFSIWLTREIFQDYLEDQDGLTEVPDTVMLQKYVPNSNSSPLSRPSLVHFLLFLLFIIIKLGG